MNRTTSSTEGPGNSYSTYYNQIPSTDEMLVYFQTALQYFQMDPGQQRIFGSLRILSLANDSNPVRSDQLVLASRNHQTGLAVIHNANRQDQREGLALIAACPDHRGLSFLCRSEQRMPRIVTIDMAPNRISLSIIANIIQPAVDRISNSLRAVWPIPLSQRQITDGNSAEETAALFPRLKHYFPSVHNGVEALLHLTGIRPKQIEDVKPVVKPVETKQVKKTLPPAMPKIVAPHAPKKTFWQSVRAFFVTFGNSVVAFFKWLFGKKKEGAIKHYSPATGIAPKSIAEILEAKGFPIDPWQKDRIAFIMKCLGMEWYSALQYADISRNCGKETQCVHPLTFLWFVLTEKEYKIGSNLPPGQSKNLLEGQSQSVQLDSCVRALYKKREGIIDAGSLMWKSFLHGENNSGGIVEKIEDSDITSLLDKFAREIDVDPSQIEGLTGSAKEIENAITLLFGKVAGEVKLSPYPVNADNN